TVRGINENGVFDSVNHKVKWGPWFDNSPRTLTYTLVIPDDFSGMATLNGTASFDGVDTAITGDRDIRISGDFSDFLIIRKESNGTRGEEEKVTITFTGTLQESTDMKIWKDVTDVSPYTTIIGKEKKFYRSVR
ncbi:MAG: hypothetical protein J6W73_04140, partial [Verrucomicrobia bacterium]|nr:hypothetical protein [Verrucomicrobiota bacterium]